MKSYFNLRDYGVEGQIGLESSPQEFIIKLLDVFDIVREKLRDDGLCFVNIGDSYAAGKIGRGETTHAGSSTLQGGKGWAPPVGATLAPVARKAPEGISSKNLLLIPERFAIAMQDSGWIVRSRIAWCKRSAMPESVRDRPTNAWEHIWMFSKSPRYFYDFEAVRQPQTGGTHSRGKGSIHAPKITMPGMGIKNNGSFQAAMVEDAPADGFANLRNYWLLSSEPNHDAHYAAYPTELVRRCILAGSRKGDTVLDPFGGSGTTGLVADRLARDAVLIELNAEYAEMARCRIDADAGPLLADPVVVEMPHQVSLFDDAPVAAAARDAVRG